MAKKSKNKNNFKEQESKYLGQDRYINHLEGDRHSESQMRGKPFEIDKDVEKSKRMKPEKIFENYSRKNSTKTKKRKKKFDKPQPIAADKNSNSYKL